MALSHGQSSSGGGEPGTERGRLTVVIEPEDLEWLQSVAAETGVDVVPVDERSFIDGASTVLLLLGGSAAVGAVAFLIDQRKGGQVFDLRPGTERLAYRTSDVIYGMVLVIAEDGTTTVEVKEPRGMFGQVIEALRGVLGDAIGQSAGVAKAAVEAGIARAEIDASTVHVH